MAIVRGLHGFDGRSAFGTWAYRITANACLDELRRRRRRPDPGLLQGRAEAASPVDDIESAVTRTDLDVALRSLPAEYRVAVVLRDLCGLSYQEISEILLVPAGTVRSRIARGRGSLIPRLAPGRNRSPSDERPTPT